MAAHAKSVPAPADGIDKTFTARQAGRMLQLRLQQAVEGVSVAAIVYYAAGFSVEPDMLIVASIPLLFVVVLIVTRRAHHRLSKDETLHQLPDAPEHL